MRRFLTIAAALYVMACPTLVGAQVAAKPVPPAQTAGPVAPSPELVAARQQIALLEAQLAAVNEFRSDSIAIVIWGLGVAVLVPSLILGIGWIANRQNYESDRVRMATAVEKDIKSQFEAQRAENKTQKDALSNALTADIRDRVASASRTLDQQVSGFDQRIFDLEFAGLEREIENRAPDGAVSSALSLLRLCIEKDLDKVPDVLDLMLKKMTAGGKFLPSELARLSEYLDKLPDRHETMRAKVRKAALEMKVFGH